MFPYDSLRDYAADLEKRGKLLRIKEMDQDAYEMTAFSYRLNGQTGLPRALLCLITLLEGSGDNTCIQTVSPDPLYIIF